MNEYYINLEYTTNIVLLNRSTATNLHFTLFTIFDGG